jgi:hypothetical protein
MSASSAGRDVGSSVVVTTSVDVGAGLVGADMVSAIRIGSCNLGAMGYSSVAWVGPKIYQDHELQVNK